MRAGAIDKLLTVVRIVLPGRFGVWCHSPPGAWCTIGRPGTLLSVRTAEEAGAAAAELRADHPRARYEVLPYEPAREPDVRRGHLSPDQVRCLRALAARADGDGPDPAAEHGKEDFAALLGRGFAKMDDSGRLVPTRAGRAVLASEGGKGR